MDLVVGKMRSFQLMKACFITIILLIFYAIFLFVQEFQHEHSIEETPLVQTIEALNEKIEQSVLQLECIAQPETCIVDKNKDLNFNSLLEKITDFKTIAASEKNEFSLVGAVEYINLEIAIKRYHDNKNAPEIYLKNLYIELTRNNLLINKNYRQLLNTHIKKHVEQESQRLLELYIVYASMAFIAIFTTCFARKEIKALATKEKLMAAELEKIGNDIEKLNAKNLDLLLNETNISTQQRRIYSYLKHIWLTLERQRQNNDLHNKLYAIIGYEMRTITNTIDGCMEYFLRDENENTQLMANSVTFATKTLSDLASNYNRLISQGAENKSGEFTFLSLISELMVSLSALAQHKQKTVNYHLEDNLPHQIEGQSISLFWMLFIQLSDAINQFENRHLLAQISTSSANNIEKSRLTISLYFLTTSNTSIEKLKKIFWSPCKAFSSNKDDLAKRVLNNDNFYQSKWSESGSQYKFDISFDLKAKSFYNEKTNFEDKKLLLFCDYALRSDVINQMLMPQSLNITKVDSINDLLANAKNFTDFHGIMISLDAPVKKVTSLYKTINSQLRLAPNTKLIMVASSQAQAIEYRQFAENVAHFPSIPSHFISKIHGFIQEMNKEEERLKVLIVEDDKVHQLLLGSILEKLNFDLYFVENGKAAIEHTKENHIDIIFMDCIMPNLSGAETAKSIREQEKERNQKAKAIIGVTALSSNLEHEACIDAGMNQVLTKPFKPEDIIKAVNKHVTIQKLNQ